MGVKKARKTGKYEKQRVRTTKNKSNAWEFHLLKHPNDKQAKKDIAECYKRSAKHKKVERKASASKKKKAPASKE